MFELTETKFCNSPLASSMSHAIDKHPDVLRKVSEPGVNLALWTRQPEHAVKQEVAILSASHFPDVRRRTSLGSFDDDVCAVLQQQGLNPENFSSLRADMQQLAARLAKVCGISEFIYRLLTIAGDECCRFHLDRTPLRLICTYQGPGTEWLADWQVDREALARSASNEEITRFGQPSQFEQFWVGIMKGESGNRGKGLVHRSPAVAGSNQIRVLFCLDSESQA